MTNARRNLTRALAVALGCALAAPASSLAQNALTVEPHPAELPPAPVVTDSAGNAYVSWVQNEIGGKAGKTIFCIVPAGKKACTHRHVLPLPTGGEEADSTYTPAQAFTVLGEPGEVLVMAPRYVREDTLYWVSYNGGESFEPVKRHPNHESVDWGSEIEDVSIDHYPKTTLRRDLEQWLVVSANNPYGEIANAGYEEEETFLGRFEGEEMLHPSLALTPPSESGQTMMLASWKNVGKPKPYEVDIRTTLGEKVAFPFTSEWTAQQKVSYGDAARLAEGPHGIYLMSVDSPANAKAGTVPTKVDVRHWNNATKKFSAPLKLETVGATAGYLFTYGAIGENPSTGRIDVAYPNLGRKTVGFWEVGETKTGALTVLDHRTVARFSGTLSSESPMRLAVAPNGDGWLSFQDGRGDQVANLKAYPALAGKFVAGRRAARTLTVPGGTSTKLEVFINGSRRASGKVKFQGFASSRCSASSKRFSGSASVSRGVAVGNVGRLRSGSYYVKAQYSGDSRDVASASRCSLAKLTVR